MRNGLDMENLYHDFIMEDICDIITESLYGLLGLKAFARKVDDAAQTVNVNECLENAVTVVWNELKYKAEVKKDYGDLPQVECFPNQICQVFTNLLVNGAHAIDEHGVITITSRREENGVIVSVADTGCAITEADTKRIFEAFYTTKPQGVGTGLGLSII